MGALVERAAAYAEAAHAGQTRDGTLEPYAKHVLRVAGRMSLDPDSDDATVAAALLHDTIEDCGVTASDIDAEFGPEVAALVVATTLPKGLPRHEKRALELSKMPALDRRAVAIKVADKTDNAKSMLISDWSQTEKQEYLAHAKAVLAMALSLRIGFPKLLDQASTELTEITRVLEA